MIIEFWRELVGTVPLGFEVIEYALASTAVLTVIVLFFRIMINFSRLFFCREYK